MIFDQSREAKPPFKLTSLPHNVVEVHAQAESARTATPKYAPLTYLVRRSLKPSGHSGASRGLAPPITTLTKGGGQKREYHKQEYMNKWGNSR